MNDQQAAIKCAELVEDDFDAWLEKKVKDYAFKQFADTSSEDTAAMVRAHIAHELASVVRCIIMDARSSRSEERVFK